LEPIGFLSIFIAVSCRSSNFRPPENWKPSGEGKKKTPEDKDKRNVNVRRPGLQAEGEGWRMGG
jgi:hypothetical protein